MNLELSVFLRMLTPNGSSATTTHRRNRYSRKRERVAHNVTEIKLASTATAAISIVVVVHLLKRGPVAAVTGHEGERGGDYKKLQRYRERAGANERR